jgi:hypothetical protein
MLCSGAALQPVEMLRFVGTRVSLLPSLLLNDTMMLALSL